MRFLFLLLDFITFFTLTTFIITVRSSSSWNISFFLSNCKVMVPIFLLNVLLLFIFSFYDLKTYYRKNQNFYMELTIAFIVAFIISSAGIYFGLNLFHIPTPKTNLLLILLIFYIYIFISRKIYNDLNFSKINILLVGTSRTLDRIKITLPSLRQYKVVDEFKDFSEIPENFDTKDIDFLLISNNLLEQDKKTSSFIFEKFVSKGIFTITDYYFFEQIFSRLPKETLKDINSLIKEISNKQVDFVYPLIKRSLDILFSLILIPIFLPIGIFIYFLILVTDKQKPIFIQKRVGFLNKNIRIYKFRTMLESSETVTKTGKFLRRLRLDEIPQLINILKGDISIVGPRPIWIKEYEFLNKFIPIHSLRTLVKPGLTGWAQLNFKAPPVYAVLETPVLETYTQKKEYFKDAIVRLAYDVWYIKNASFKLDCEIILKTAKRMFIKDKKLTN